MTNESLQSIKSVFERSLKRELTKIAGEMSELTAQDLINKIQQEAPQDNKAEAPKDKKKLKKIANDILIYPNIARELKLLRTDSFEIKWKVEQDALTAIEGITNKFTSELVKDVHGKCKYSIPDRTDPLGHAEMLITFADNIPDNQKNAVLYVAQNFASRVQSSPTRHAGVNIDTTSASAITGYNENILMLSVNSAMRKENQLPTNTTLLTSGYDFDYTKIAASNGFGKAQ